MVIPLTPLQQLMDYKLVQVMSLIGASVLAMLWTPHTKVEESFQMQATHDMFFIGFRRFYRAWYNLMITGSTHGRADELLASMNASAKAAHPFYQLLAPPPPVDYEVWDHEEFPGAVPRTFVGPFIMALMSWPCMFVNVDKMYVQMLVRMQLGAALMIAYARYSTAVCNRFGKYTRNLLIVITTSQFHLIFYSSRLLPNTFAMVLVLLGLTCWLERRFSTLIAISAFTVVIFRFDTAVLFGLIFVYEVVYARQLSVWRLLRVGVPCGVLAALFSTWFDSYFWGRTVLPELYGLLFNVIENKSHLWGVKPFYWYFLNALPRMLMFTTPLVFFASRRITLKIGPVALMFVAIFSVLPHKELRFLFYVMPLLNTLAANAVAVVFMRLDLLDEMSESWLWNILRRRFFDGVYKEDEYDKRFVEMERIERESEMPRPEPTRYDALGDVPGYNPYGLESLMQLQQGQLRRRQPARAASAGRQEPARGGQPAGAQAGGRAARGANAPQAGRGNRPQTPPPPPAAQLQVPQPTRPEPGVHPTIARMMERVTLKIFALIMLCSLHLCLNMAVSIYMGFVSTQNYPGGEAMSWLSDSLRLQMEREQMRPADFAVHIDNLVAQTGYTRFLEVNGVRYDKTPNFLANLGRPANRSQACHSLNVDFSQSKVNYLLLENVDPNFVRRYCPLSQGKVLPEGPVLSHEHLSCDFGRNNRDCHVSTVIYGFASIHTNFDGNFLNLRKSPMIFVFRCLGPRHPQFPTTWKH